MIYLIEDKTSRRNDYGWSDKRIVQYKDTITVVDSIQDLLNYSDTILSSDNIVLYHESFANTADYDQKIELGSFLNEIKNHDYIDVLWLIPETKGNFNDIVTDMNLVLLQLKMKNILILRSAKQTRKFIRIL